MVYKRVQNTSDASDGVRVYQGRTGRQQAIPAAGLISGAFEVSSRAKTDKDPQFYGF